ncbi:hypothetical protein FQR65_LT02800 [Abscondita terminalis]|nr:hypothetical protein FQR65_LT02800 [Abscondita terminalis]
MRNLKCQNIYFDSSAAIINEIFGAVKVTITLHRWVSAVTFLTTLGVAVTRMNSGCTWEK